MADEPKPKHTLADHRLGIDLAHTHDGYADHDHDLPDDMPPEDNPIWVADHVTLTSVGIDVGSSGTQVIFSRVNMRRFGEDLSSRYYVASRETLYQSPVAFTPYRSAALIDETALGAIIDAAYGAARMTPADIDTGVVILTGEALRRENAEAIAGIVAEKGGDLVCATAGHHMEAMLAAYGSGAAALSADRHARLLNVDIGGGTTKLAVIDHGQVVATAAVHVGGRLQVVDTAGRIARIDPAGEAHAARAGFAWRAGDICAPRDLDRVADCMADAIVAAMAQRPLPPNIADLYLTPPIEFGRIDGIVCSGGVAEYIYGREERDFGDMGRRLGRAMRLRLDAGALPWPLLPAGECIRATALGASEYSVQLSGNTSFISNPAALLPRRNLQVLQPQLALDDHIEAGRVRATIRAHMTAFDVVPDGEFALALRWRGSPSHARLAAFAQGIRDALADRIDAGRALYILLDGDVAQTLGGILRDEIGIRTEMLVIDGIVLWDFDYIDLGRIRLPSNTVPVTIKSLVFSRMSAAAPSRVLGHDHHHDHHGRHEDRSRR